MIDIDPREYLGEDYLIRWQCPACRERSFIRLGDIHHAACPRCDEMLSEADRRSLSAFRRLIA